MRRHILLLLAVLAIAPWEARAQFTGAGTSFSDVVANSPAAILPFSATDAVPIIQKVGGKNITHKWLPSAAGGSMFTDAANAVLPDVLINFGHGIQLAASVACTTVSGSAAVAGCSSTTGIAAGMLVRGPGVVDGSKVAGSITATGFTLDTVASASATSLLTIQHLPFWTDEAAAGVGPGMAGDASIWRFPGRVMVGNAIGLPSKRFDPVYTFCPTAPYCANWAARDSDLAVMSSRGAMAITGMSRASDSGTGAFPPPSIGVAGFVIGDVFRAGGMWASYWDVQLNSEADGGVMMGMEIALKNRGGNYKSTPYDYTQPGVYGIRLSPGGAPDYGGANLNPINAGIVMGPISGEGSYRANTGILFTRYALAGTEGDTDCCGVAIEMAKGQNIVWKAPSDNGDGFTIHSAVGSGTNGIQLLAADNTLYVFAGDGGVHRAFQLVHNPGAVTNIKITDGVTFPAIVNYSDSVTDVLMYIASQGNGEVVLANQTSGNLAHFLPSGAGSYAVDFVQQHGSTPAIIGSNGGATTIKGHYFIMNTDTYTVTEPDSGTHYDNIGATAPVVFNLPPAARGLNYCFTVDAAFQLSAKANGTDKIAIAATNGAAGGYLYASVPFASACIQSHKAGQWEVISTPDAAQWALT